MRIIHCLQAGLLAGLAVMARPAAALPPAVREVQAESAVLFGSGDMALATAWDPQLNGGEFITVGKVNPGTTMWEVHSGANFVNTLDSYPGNSGAIAYGVAVKGEMSDGSFWVAGEEYMGGGTWHGIIRHYDNMGYPSGPTTDEQGSGPYRSGFYGLVPMGTMSGTVYLAVGTRAFNSMQSNCLIRKYTDSGGGMLMTDMENSGEWGGGMGFDAFYGVAFMGGMPQNVYAVGRIWVPGEGYNAIVRRYDDNIVSMGSLQLDSGAKADDAYMAVAAANNFVFAAGYSDRPDLQQGRDWRVASMPATLGAANWEVSYNGAADGDDEATGILVLPDASVLVVGTVDRSDVGEGKNWMVRRYNGGNGALIGESVFASVGKGDDRPNQAIMTPSDQVRVVGGAESPADVAWRAATYEWSGTLPYLDASATIDKANVVPGDLVTVTLTVTATGAGFNNVTPGISFYNSSPPASVVTSPSAVSSLGSGSKAVFDWTFSVTGAGFLGFTVSASGQDTTYSQNQTVRAYAAANALRARLVLPPVLVQGMVATATLYVANDGMAKLKAVTPALCITGAGTTVMIMSAPSLTATTIQPLSERAYVWTITVSGAGAAVFSVTVTGNYASPAEPQFAALAVSATSITAANLAFAISTSGTRYVPGMTVRIACTVTNTGEEPALLGFLVTPNAGGQYMTILDSVPAGIAFGNSSTTLVWSFVANDVSSLQTVVFSMTALGAGITGFMSGNPLGWTLTANGQLDILKPGQLAATVSVDADAVVFGAPFVIQLTVTNTGDTTVAGVAPTLGFLQGKATAFTGWSPASASLGLGEAALFTWSGTASSIGPIRMTVSAAGNESFSGLPVTVVVGSAITSKLSATFEAELLVSPSPAILVDHVTVTYRVSNGGQYAAVGVAPEIGIPVGAELVKAESGPVPAAIGALNAGSTQDFVWTYRVLKSGTVSFTATVTGTDAGTSNAMVKAATATVSITRLQDTNLPDPGTFHVRHNILRIKDGATGTVVVRGRGAGGSVDLFLYSRAGLPLGRVGAAAVTLDGNGLGLLSFDGRVGGKPLASGMYWIVATGAVKDKQRVVIVNE